MNAANRTELGLQVQALRRLCVRLDSLVQREGHAGVREHLNAAAERVDGTIDHLQQAIERSAARPGATVQHPGPATRLRVANERAKGRK